MKFWVARSILLCASLLAFVPATGAHEMPASPVVPADR